MAHTVFIWLLQFYLPVYSINMNWAHIHYASCEILMSDMKAAVHILKKLAVHEERRQVQLYKLQYR